MNYFCFSSSETSTTAFGAYLTSSSSYFFYIASGIGEAFGVSFLTSVFVNSAFLSAVSTVAFFSTGFSSIFFLDGLSSGFLVDVSVFFESTF